MQTNLGGISKNPECESVRDFISLFRSCVAKNIGCAIIPLTPASNDRKTVEV